MAQRTTIFVYATSEQQKKVEDLARGYSADASPSENFPDVLEIDITASFARSFIETAPSSLEAAVYTGGPNPPEAVASNPDLKKMFDDQRERYTPRPLVEIVQGEEGSKIQYIDGALSVPPEVYALTEYSGRDAAELLKFTIEWAGSVEAILGNTDQAATLLDDLKRELSKILDEDYFRRPVRSARLGTGGHNPNTYGKKKD